MLDTDEINRRMVAARTLRELSQTDLDALGAADGLGKQELSRVERGELPMTRVRREVATRLLRVPANWFTADDVDDILRSEAATLYLSASHESALVEAIGQLSERFDAVERNISQLLEEAPAPAPSGELRRELEDAEPNPPARGRARSPRGTDARRGSGG